MRNKLIDRINIISEGLPWGTVSLFLCAVVGSLKGRSGLLQIARKSRLSQDDVRTEGLDVVFLGGRFRFLRSTAALWGRAKQWLSDLIRRSN